jgi:DNA ligase-3
MMKTISEGLEGLVIKDANSKYEPGKRHWLKMKKDYLDEGSMADTADLVVLGAYYGTGNKGGLKSVFLMGCYNEKTHRWQTVTKCGNGFDDKTIDRLSKELDMIEINKDFNKVPDWLDIHRSLVPDFVMRNPKAGPVWEITGAEFSTSDTHTAGGISIRFPRVTRVRDDKSWKEATDLARLKVNQIRGHLIDDLILKTGFFKELFKISKEKTDVEVHQESDNVDDDEDECEKPNAKKRQAIDSDVEPKKDTNRKKLKTGESKQLLPGIFSNVKIYIPDGTESLAKLKRYVIS